MVYFREWFDIVRMQHLVRVEGRTYCLDGLATADEAVAQVSSLLGLPEGLPWRAEQDGRFQALAAPLTPSPLLLLPCPGLRGGKGGFGAQLRAIGAQIEATTNHGAMRDIGGRRRRDIEAENRVRRYVDGAADREKKEREKKEAKLEKLKLVAEGGAYNRDKHSFADPEYDKARGEVEEKIHDAVEAAMAAGGERSLKEVEEVRKEVEQEAGGSGVAAKRKGEPEKKVAVKRSKGWADLEDLSDEDLTDSSDEEKEEKEEENAAVVKL